MGRAHYYSRMAVAPDNANEAYFLTASYAKSIDGGTTIVVAAARAKPRAATTTTSGSIRRTPNRQIVAHDQGLSITDQPRQDVVPPAPAERADVPRDRGQRDPLQRLGNKQDGPTYRGPSNSRLQGGFGGEPGIPRGDVARGRRRRERLGDARSRRTRTSSGPRRPAPACVGGIVVRFEETGASSATSRCGPISRTARPRA